MKIDDTIINGAGSFKKEKSIPGTADFGKLKWDKGKPSALGVVGPQRGTKCSEARKIRLADPFYSSGIPSKTSLIGGSETTGSTANAKHGTGC